MKAWFSLPERIDALMAAVDRWVGTPFHPNSYVCGTGANCVFAIVGVLTEAGFVMDVGSIPHAASGWSRNNTRSIQAEWLDAQPVFSPIAPQDGVLQPGDVVGFKVGQCIHHLGLILPNDKFYQCRKGPGAEVLSMQEKHFRERLSRAWRPIEI